MQQRTEAEMVRAAQADPQHFAPLYHRYHPEIYRFLLRRAHGRELTADLVQQTFLKAMLALKDFEPRGVPFKAWLYRIAFNEIRMHWRRRKEMVVDMHRDDALVLAEEVGTGPDETDLQRLASALARLNGRQARLMELRFVDGLSFADIGAILGIGEDAAKMRTHRALEKLRSIMKRAR